MSQKLLDVCEAGDLSLVTKLIEGCMPWNILITACKGGNKEIIELLLKKRMHHS